MIEVVATTIDAVPAVPSDKISMSSFPSPTTVIDFPADVVPLARATPGPVMVTVIDSATAALEELLLITRITAFTVDDAVDKVLTALSVNVPQVDPAVINADDLDPSTDLDAEARAATVMVTSAVDHRLPIERKAEA